MAEISRARKRAKDRVELLESKHEKQVSCLNQQHAKKLKQNYQAHQKQLQKIVSKCYNEKRQAAKEVVKMKG